jgi:hypothetical protein
VRAALSRCVSRAGVLDLCRCRLVVVLMFTDVFDDVLDLACCFLICTGVSRCFPDLAALTGLCT